MYLVYHIGDGLLARLRVLCCRIVVTSAGHLANRNDPEVDKYMIRFANTCPKTSPVNAPLHNGYCSWFGL